ncbi:TRAP transporter permease [Denitromonas halophila]|uniref:TRAP transporter fused permease subunit n=1 Tax=Denitromonas halophila TaxID=1629404 RepID=A0A557QJE7_9RHOO|nr:TRAP transporter fused permease subunit [Denitromonas halophila]TVO53030.1 TRAP transporter fused permease subunit [Denitromonas halophila]
MDTLRHKAVMAVALVLSLFVLYTSAFGVLDALVQRSTFLALVVVLALLRYPLGAGKAWRPLGAVVDLALGLVAVGSCAWIATHSDQIMDSLPTAGLLEIAMAASLIVVILEMSRRAIGLIFPSMVLIGLLYALLGSYIPGRLGHRGFDIYFMTETLLLGDIGIWGSLLGVAATIIAVFSLFGSFLLHSGGGAAFMDIALRVSGRSTGGAAKIATIASGLFGMVSGSAVGNVATTGTFTIPLMKRLGYPAALAGAVEAVASTGGQLAPPIMGAAAFIMAEIISVDYVTIALAAILPAALFYIGVFGTVHVTAREQRLGQVPDDQIPAWESILKMHRLAPIACAFVGLGIGITNGNSIQTSAFFGIAGTVIGVAIGRLWPARGGDDETREPVTKQLRSALDDGANSLVVVGVLLAGAQILVAMINLTGIGVTLSSMIVGEATASVLAVGLIVAAICMIMGMGIPTTAAYVLVAATLAPALVKVGVSPLAAHMFVFYFATLSVITPPVCVGVFVAAGIAGVGWTQVARHAVSLGAVTYVIPFLFLLYPGMLTPGSAVEYIEAALSGVVFVTAFAHLFGGAQITGRRLIDIPAWLGVALAAIYPHEAGLVIGIAAVLALMWLSRRRYPAANAC